MSAAAARKASKACRMSAAGASSSNSVLKVRDMDTLSKLLQEAAGQENLVVLEFMADWNVPCNNMTKDVEKMADEFAGKVMFLALNIDNFKDIAEYLSVQVLPTFLLVKGYYVQDEVVGVKKKELQRKITEYTGNDK